MPRIRRVIIVIVAIVVAVPALAALALTLIDVNRFRGTIENAVENATGRQVTIAGDVSLTLGRPIALAVDDVTIGNPPWAARPDMAQVGRIELDVGLLALFRGALVVERVLVEDLDVYLETDAQGTGNWQLNTEASPDPLPESSGGPAAETAAAGDETSQPSVSLPIGRAMAENVRVHWIEGAEKAPAIVLNVASVAIEHVSANGPAALRVSTLPTPAVPPIDMSGNLNVNGAEYRFDDLRLQTGDTDVSGNLTITAAVDDRRPAVSAHLTATRIDLADLSGTTPVGSGDAGQAKPASRAPASQRVIPDVEFPLQHLSAVDAELELRVDTLARDRTTLAEGITVTATLRDGTLAARTAVERLANGQGELTVDATDGGAITIDATVNQIGLDQLATNLGSPSAINGGQLDGNLSLSGNGPDLRRLLAHSKGTVRLVVRNAATSNRWLYQLGGDIVSQVAGALNPRRARDSTIRIGCAVADARIARGRMTFLRGLALETDLVDANGSGTVNLGNEHLDIGVRAQANEGLGVGVANLASRFVRIRGTLAKPAITVDLLDTAGDVARLGAGIITDVLSGNTPSLRDVFTAEPHPCAVALGEIQPTKARQPSGNGIDKQLKRGIDDFGKRLKGWFD